MFLDVRVFPGCERNLGQLVQVGMSKVTLWETEVVNFIS